MRPVRKHARTRNTLLLEDKLVRQNEMRQSKKTITPWPITVDQKSATNTVKSQEGCKAWWMDTSKTAARNATEHQKTTGTHDEVGNSVKGMCNTEELTLVCRNVHVGLAGFCAR